MPRETETTEIKKTKFGMIKHYVYLRDFIREHKKRLIILKDINYRYNNRKIIFQLSILGIESLARYYKPNEKNPNKRVRLLLSKVLGKKEAGEFYELFRNSYIHDGFTNPFLDWEDYDNSGVGGLSEKDVDNFDSGVDYPKETIMGIYEYLVNYINDYFNKKKIGYRIIKQKALLNKTGKWQKIITF